MAAERQQQRSSSSRSHCPRRGARRTRQPRRQCDQRVVAVQRHRGCSASLHLTNGSSCFSGAENSGGSKSSDGSRRLQGRARRARQLRRRCDHHGVVAQDRGDAVSTCSSRQQQLLKTTAEAKTEITACTAARVVADTVRDATATVGPSNPRDEQHQLAARAQCRACPPRQQCDHYGVVVRPQVARHHNLQLTSTEMFRQHQTQQQQRQEHLLRGRACRTRQLHQRCDRCCVVLRQQHQDKR